MDGCVISLEMFSTVILLPLRKVRKLDETMDQVDSYHSKIGGEVDYILLIFL